MVKGCFLKFRKVCLSVGGNDPAEGKRLGIRAGERAVAAGARPAAGLRWGQGQPA